MLGDGTRHEHAAPIPKPMNVPSGAGRSFRRKIGLPAYEYWQSSLRSSSEEFFNTSDRFASHP
jgi:hypothetical protein